MGGRPSKKTKQDDSSAKPLNVEDERKRDDSSSLPKINTSDVNREEPGIKSGREDQVKGTKNDQSQPFNDTEVSKGEGEKSEKDGNRRLVTNAELEEAARHPNE